MKKKRKISIAIDGPAGSGKSTVARRLADELGLLYIDTGAMYRAITLKALRRGISLHDKADLTVLTKETRLDFKQMPDGSHHLLMDQEDVQEEIRFVEVNEGVSFVASVKEVREVLVKRQREFGVRGGVVMDGRDIGSVVLPQAEWKIFLTASLPERARRRWRELQEKGLAVSLPEVETSLSRRDELDSSRKVDPLRPALDSVQIDTTDMGIEKVVDTIKKLVSGGKPDVL